MGILDHTRTWTFTTSASPTDCLRAFASCLDRRGGAVMGSVWSVAVAGGRGSQTAVATYEGRAGMIGAFSTLSTRAQQEQAAAIGSQLTFTAGTRSDGTTTATMAMTRTTTVFLFLTADARFFRSAMNRVARHLRDNDAEVELVKH